MNFPELQSAGRMLRAEAVNQHLLALMRDPKFPAVLAWLERNEKAWAAALTNQKLAADHGKLAHAAGSLYALQILLGQLQNLTDKRADRRDEGVAENRD